MSESDDNIALRAEVERQARHIEQLQKKIDLDNNYYRLYLRSLQSIQRIFDQTWRSENEALDKVERLCAERDEARAEVERQRAEVKRLNAEVERLLVYAKELAEPWLKQHRQVGS